MFIREDMADIRVWVDEIPYGDAWANAEGGNLSADSNKTRPGAMGYEVAVGAPGSRSDLTVRTQFTEVSASWVPTLESKVSTTGRVRVGISWLNPDRTPTGLGRTLHGTLREVNPPNPGSGTAAGMLELVVDCDELAA
jgi:hypothetical protein